MATAYHAGGGRRGHLRVEADHKQEWRHQLTATKSEQAGDEPDCRGEEGQQHGLPSRPLDAVGGDGGGRRGGDVALVGGCMGVSRGHVIACRVLLAHESRGEGDGSNDGHQLHRKPAHATGRARAARTASAELGADKVGEEEEPDAHEATHFDRRAN